MPEKTFEHTVKNLLKMKPKPHKEDSACPKSQLEVASRIRDSAWALAACGDSTGSGDPGKLRVQRPSAAVTAPCARPAPIPTTATTQGAQETLWRRDRLSLADCADRHAVAVEWIDGIAEEFYP